MRQYLSAHIETNNADYGHASTNHVRLPGLEGREIDSRLPGPYTLRLVLVIVWRPLKIRFSVMVTVRFSFSGANQPYSLSCLPRHDGGTGAAMFVQVSSAANH